MEALVSKKSKTKQFVVLPNDDQTNYLDNNKHPDYMGEIVSENIFDQVIENDKNSDIENFDTPIKRQPFPSFPIRFCSPVSGRYKLKKWNISVPIERPRLPLPLSMNNETNELSVFPKNNLSVVVRVDVDRFFPQNRLSVEFVRSFPFHREHVVAEVISDTCAGINNRTITADIIYRDGNSTYLTGSKLVFKASRGTGIAYQNYSLNVNVGTSSERLYRLDFVSQKFDDVEFEVDRVSNSGSVYTTYDTHDHPNRPTNLPNENISLARVFERAGFNVAMSPNGSVIPTTGAGANGTWSNAEMHNAMVTYWSRFANRPEWAMWVLYAARHDMGSGLGGIMFDDIGSNHRQGTAIFTDSFIKNPPIGDPDPAGWRRRHQFWTAIHEMGHGFNLAHSWQKSLSVSPQTGPWIPLANEPEARSFMNYPPRVSGGQSSFFNDFRFRFSDEELKFMRHAPRRFVQMGNSSWFENHGFEQPNDVNYLKNWEFEIRPNRSLNTYSFLEPVRLELKLTNISSNTVQIDPDLLEDGKHITVFIQKETGSTKQWQPMLTKCHKPHAEKVDSGESIYGAHLVSCSTNGWLIDEPGFYKIQAAINMGTEIVVSNVLRIYVAPPVSKDEAVLACDYFIEDVGRVLTFNGVPFLNKAHDVLKNVIEITPENPAAVHAIVADTATQLKDFKLLEVGATKDQMQIRGVQNDAVKTAIHQAKTLLENVDDVADTLGHIRMFDQCRELTDTLKDHDATDEASAILDSTISAMKHRNILGSVVTNAEKRLSRLSK